MAEMVRNWKAQMTEVKLKRVIDPIRHARLLAGIDEFCETAGIPPSFIHKNVREGLTDHEVAWLRDYPTHQKDGEGLLMTETHDPDPVFKMQLMTAAFLRNFIDARMIPVNTVLEYLDDKMMPDCAVVLIPNLYQVTHGKAFQSYKIQALYDLFLFRQARGLLSVVYVESMAELRKDYGPLFASHLENFVLDKGSKKL
jgi:hypothetical protein